MTKVSLTQFGYQKGKEDKLARNCYDPYRWCHAWASDWWKYEQAYTKGYEETPYPYTQQEAQQ